MSKGSSLVARLEAEASRYGFLRTHHGHRTGWEVRCSKCPKIFTAGWPPSVPTEMMIKNMRKRSWDVGQGMRPLCPDCAHASDQKPKTKPNHQSFTLYAPPLPKTLIAASLLDAGVTLALKDVPEVPSFDEWKAEQATKPPSVMTGVLDEADLRGHKARKGELLDKLADAMTNKMRATSKLLEAQQKRAEHAREIRLARVEERRKRKADQTVQDQIKLRDIAEKAKQNPPAEPKMQTQPNLKITHTVFQLLDSIFDRNKRLYRSGYSDARVAKDAGTTEDVVAALRVEVYGTLAEDPRIQSVKDDIALLEMQQAELNKNFERSISDLNSRVEQLRSNLGR